MNDSSDNEGKEVVNSGGEGNEVKTRKNIRKVWTKSSLSESTIQAEKEELERKARIVEKQKKVTHYDFIK